MYLVLLIISLIVNITTLGLLILSFKDVPSVSSEEKKDLEKVLTDEEYKAYIWNEEFNSRISDMKHEIAKNIDNGEPYNLPHESIRVNKKVEIEVAD